MTKRLHEETEYEDGIKKRVKKDIKSSNTRYNTTCNFKLTKTKSKPLCVLEQLHYEKSALKDIIDDSNTSKFKTTILFLFKPNDIKGLKLCQELVLEYGKNIKITGITPFPSETTHYNFDIISDNNGQIAKNLDLRDPLGGGIYSITSFLVYNSIGHEVVRFQVDYDKQIDFAIRQVIAYLNDL